MQHKKANKSYTAGQSFFSKTHTHTHTHFSLGHLMCVKSVLYIYYFVTLRLPLKFQIAAPNVSHVSSPATGVVLGVVVGLVLCVCVVLCLFRYVCERVFQKFYSRFFFWGGFFC